MTTYYQVSIEWLLYDNRLQVPLFAQQHGGSTECNRTNVQKIARVYDIRGYDMNEYEKNRIGDLNTATTNTKICFWLTLKLLERPQRFLEMVNRRKLLIDSTLCSLWT